MKGLFASLLIATAASAQAAEPNLDRLSNGIHSLSNAFLCDTFKGVRTGLGNAIETQCTQRAAAEFAAIPDQKTLRECIKPGNVIDEDVRKCMKGM